VVRRVRAAASFVAGVALGSAIMYFLDPRTGANRRALARDRLSSGSRSYAGLTGKRLRHLRNQLGGLVAASTDWLRTPAIDSDRKIADRIRARLGRVTEHMQGLGVEVREGQVVLSGALSDEEAVRVVAETQRIPGVKTVKDAITRSSGECATAACS
jgi:hypothetical protein